ncbi:calcium-binding protein, partial [Pseudomonas capeferrum]|uniref:calcium-binding protein n=1 Tax=Pseudomonas capeferrum TaxID=1495066 RepID=UPI0030D840B6
EVNLFDFAVGTHHGGLAPERNRERSIGLQVVAWNVGFMERVRAIARVAQVNGNDPVKGIIDLIEFSSAMAGSTGWASSHIELAGTWVRQLNSQQLDELKIQLGTGSSLVVDTVTDSTLQGGASSDFLFGEAGNDNLYGNDGVDFLDGGAGNDRLHGGNGNDILLGGEGNDSLYGGAGNDTLSGDADSDVYRFSRGWGQDTVNNNDSSTGKVDAIEFAADIASSDILVTRSSNNLILSLAGSTDKVTVSNYFTSDGASYYKLEEIRFADGTVWSYAHIKAMTLFGTDHDDVLTDLDNLGELHGGAGNDTLDGGSGSNRLYGDASDDVLKDSTSASNNLFVGGTGNQVVKWMQFRTRQLSVRKRP